MGGGEICAAAAAGHVIYVAGGLAVSGCSAENRALSVGHFYLARSLGGRGRCFFFLGRLEYFAGVSFAFVGCSFKDL